MEDVALGVTVGVTDGVTVGVKDFGVLVGVFGFFIASFEDFLARI